MIGPCKSRLLVAMPMLFDPNFDRTVVLMLEHTDEGALGVVLNRPTDTAVLEPLPAWDGLAADPAVVFVGGPVGQGAAIGLARSSSGGVEPAAGGWAPLFDGLGTVDLSRSPDDLGPGLDAVRIFTGYAGWGPGQLEEEVEAGAWLIVDALPGDALWPDPDNLWRAVLRRQGGEVAWLANFPRHPAWN